MDRSLLHPGEIRITKDNYPALFFYLIGLGVTALFIQSLFIFGFLFVFHITLLSQHLLWRGIPTIIILLLLTAAHGAFARQKWGLRFNLFCLIFFIPFFVVFPMVMLWIVPHSGVELPTISFIFGAFIAGFDIFYFYWFIKNRKSFIWKENSCLKGKELL